MTVPTTPPRIPPTTPPRIPPLRPDEYDDEVRELLGGIDLPAAGGGTGGGSGVLNIFATLVRHRGLYRRWLPFGGKLLAGRIPPRLRELAILRTAWLCRAEYEWGQHVGIAKLAGVTESEIASVRDGATGEWEPIEQAVITAADELHADSRISDATWSRLAAEWDERQLIELPMLVGHYHLVAFALNSLGVEREPGVPGF